MIKWSPLAGIVDTRPMEGEVVRSRREIDVVGIGCPLDTKTENVHIKTPHVVEGARKERQMPDPKMRGPNRHRAQFSSEADDDVVATAAASPVERSPIARRRNWSVTSGESSTSSCLFKPAPLARRLLRT